MSVDTAYTATALQAYATKVAEVIPA